MKRSFLKPTSKVPLWGTAEVVLALISLVVSLSASIVWDQRSKVEMFLSREATQIGWVVFLAPHADHGVIEDKIRSAAGVHSVVFVSEEDALSRAQKDPSLSEALPFTSRNPFPSSFEVRWNPAFIRENYLAPLSEQLKLMEGVSAVGYDRSRVDRYALLTEFLTQLDLAISLLAWSWTAVILFLLGRGLFFSVGMWRPAPLLVRSLFGLLGGGGTLLLDHFLFNEWGWICLPLGWAVGLSMGLWSAVSQ